MADSQLRQKSQNKSIKRRQGENMPSFSFAVENRNMASRFTVLATMSILHTGLLCSSCDRSSLSEYSLTITNIR